MRLKSVVFCMITLMFVLFGCNQEDDSYKNVQALKVYNLDIDFFNEFDVCNFENICVYFPVVTNKEITSSDLAGVGAKFNLKEAYGSDKLIKVKLTKTEQDKINIKYKNYYISFLKYKLEFSHNLNKNDYTSIDLNDTKIWILCDKEIQPVNFNETYLKINIIQNSNLQNITNWEQIISNIMQKIKLQFP